MRTSFLFRQLRRPRFGQVAATLSLLALMALVFVGGAAAMFFGLPPSGPLTRAFLGFEAWRARGGPVEGPGSALTATGDKSEKAFAGFTLVTTTRAAEAQLLDMKGKVVHAWKMPFRRGWPRAAKVRDPLLGEPIHWERCHLFPNGDLLALCCVGGGTPYGYGLAKFDKDSRLLWGVSGNFHHDFDVGEDGRAYALVQETREDAAGVEGVPVPYMADFLIVLSPEGRQQESIPLLEAFRGTAYVVPLLSSQGADPTRPGPSITPNGSAAGPPALPGLMPNQPFAAAPGDIMHANSVKVLSRELAAHFPQFRPGQALLSLRSPSLLAVLDLPKRSIVWAARGPWQFQHDAQFLDNGRIVLFDNLGSRRTSRVLEYDPTTQGVPWSYPDEKSPPFLAPFRGRAQRLPNGNTLFVHPDRRVVEVTPEKEIVWEWGLGPTAGGNLDCTCARRYAPEALPFLKGAARVRPH